MIKISPIRPQELCDLPLAGNALPSTVIGIINKLIKDNWEPDSAYSEFTKRELSQRLTEADPKLGIYSNYELFKFPYTNVGWTVRPTFSVSAKEQGFIFIYPADFSAAKK